MDIGLPKTLRTASLLLKEGPNKQVINYVDASQGDNQNSINLKLDGLKLSLEAISSSDDTTSSYSKQFKLPKGTETDKISYRIDNSKHSLIVEAPIKIAQNNTQIYKLLLVIFLYTKFLRFFYLYYYIFMGREILFYCKF